MPPSARRPLGRTLAKRRCLEVRGWRVLSVPGHEWRALGGSEAAQEVYLRAALDGALWRTHVLPGMGLEFEVGSGMVAGVGVGMGMGGGRGGGGGGGRSGGLGAGAGAAGVTGR